MRGRRPKPTALKKLQGNPGRRPLNTAEPKPPRARAVPPCPPYLEGEARREWHRMAPMLSASGMMSLADATALAAYCQARRRRVEPDAGTQLPMLPQLPIASARDHGSS